MLTKSGGRVKYDFGGAEFPRQKDFIVVDVMKRFSWEKLGFKNTYLERDIGRRWLGRLRPAELVNVSRVLRYLCPLRVDRGTPYSDAFIKVMLAVAANIDGSLLPGGRVCLFDHLEALGLVVEELICRGYQVRRMSLENPRDLHLPAEWQVILKKPLERR